MATIWIAYDKSRARLPIAMADSAVKLAKMVGVSDLTVRSIVSRAEMGLYKNPRFAKVEIVEDEE